MLVRPDLQTTGLRAVRLRLYTTDAVPHSYIIHTIRAFSVVQSLGELPQVVLHRFSEISAMENSVRGILPLAPFAQPTGVFDTACSRPMTGIMLAWNCVKLLATLSALLSVRMAVLARAAWSAGEFARP
jgi:hypothetical protein